MLLEIEQQFLLKIARESMTAAVNGTTAPLQEPLTATLKEYRGAFVTLHNKKELRGCIGYAEPLHSLNETVSIAAAKAATEDLRFERVTRNEIPSIRIEISVLSEMKQVKDYHEIEIGHHGIMLQTDRYRGLLLPQVAVHNGWDQLTFLNHVSQKAGLPPNAWKKRGTELFVFSAEVFQETD